MVLAQTSERSPTHEGIRPIDLRRDLRPIADLIGDAFAGELDASGQASLREMRTLARLGPFLYLFVPAGGELGGFFRGFVWESEGEIVGNVTLQQADNYGKRWMIANVAVRRDYRGRGVARNLMDAALTRIRQLGGVWALLQVRADNDVAKGLYEHLGFSNVVTETQLRRFEPPRTPDPHFPQGAELTPIYDDAWEAVQYLLNQATPELARWWRPRRNRKFQRGSDGYLWRRWGHLVGRGHRQRLGLYLDSELAGILDIDSNPRGEQGIDVLLHPEARAAWTRPLLDYGFRQLRRYPTQPVVATLYDYQPEAIASLEQVGFHAVSVLITMRKRVQSLSERYS